MIVGIGVDIAEIDRIEAAITRHGAPFLTRIYTPRESAYCESHKNKLSATPRASPPKKQP